MATGILVIRSSRPFAAKSAPNWVLVSMAHTKMSDYCTNVINIIQHCSLIYIHIFIHCDTYEI